MKCIKNTPAYFAERLHKAMQVRLCFLKSHFILNYHEPAVSCTDIGRGEVGGEEEKISLLQSVKLDIAMF